MFAVLCVRVCVNAVRFTFIRQIANENFDKNMFETILFNTKLLQLKINVSIRVVCGKIIRKIIVQIVYRIFVSLQASNTIDH